MRFWGARRVPQNLKAPKPRFWKDYLELCDRLSLPYSNPTLNDLTRNISTDTALYCGLIWQPQTWQP